MSESGVQVLNIFGQDYSIRASLEEQVALERAATLLQEQLKISEQRYPNARTHELLVLTALNLCVPLSQAQDQLAMTQERLNALLERLDVQLPKAL